MKLMKTVPYLFILAAAAAFLMTARAPAQNVRQPYAGEPEVVAATFASAWCSACKILKPKLAAVIPDFDDDPVAFIEFDFTFGANAGLEALADEYGVTDIYKRNKGATGFTVLVDRDTGEIIDTLTMNFSEKAMRAAISRAVAVSSYTDKAPLADAAGDI